MSGVTSGARSGGVSVLRAYLLGLVDFDAALALQRYLVYQVGGDRESAALILCEHPPLVTVGRLGSRAHILFDPDDLTTRRWPVRWVNRGGGCLLHLPGQLAIYPVVALDQLGLGIQDYLDRLHEAVVAVLDDFGIRGETRQSRPGVWVNGKLIAEVGIAVRDWVAYYGVYLNVNPDPHPFRGIHCGGPGEPPMTSLERERRGPLRPGMVRERLLEHFSRVFRCERTSLFAEHPFLTRRPATGTVTAHS